MNHNKNYEQNVKIYGEEAAGLARSHAIYTHRVEVNRVTYQDALSSGDAETATRAMRNMQKYYRAAEESRDKFIALTHSSEALAIVT